MNLVIVDTETANGLECPLPYDLGYRIINAETFETLVERSFVIAEIFLDDELMASAYYADKKPQYWQDIKNGKRKLVKACTARRILWNDLKTYNVKEVGAYNMGFDKRAVRNDIRFITASALRWFFPYHMEYFCIWNMACTSILQTAEYIEFCLENGLISPKGNILTSAEAVYKYLTGNTDFSESHTGLEDVAIETEIFRAVIESGMDYEKEVKGAPWQKVKKFYKMYKEMGE